MTHDRTFEVYSACPICGSRAISDLWQVNRYTVARCQDCTNRFVRERLTLEALFEHYASSEPSTYVDENSDWLKYYYSKAAKLVRSYHPTPGKILDIGCSRGWFFDEMTGWECYGTEISSRDATAARERGNATIFVGAFEEMPEREAFFDVITMQDVLDHLIDPLESLKRVIRQLKPGGTLLIKVHDFSCLYARLSGSRFYAIIPPSHLFYYTRPGLRKLVELAGFEPVAARHIGNRLQIKTVFLRLARDNTKSLNHKIYQWLGRTSAGNLHFIKNLHDIITLVARKPEER